VLSIINCTYLVFHWRHWNWWRKRRHF